MHVIQEQAVYPLSARSQTANRLTKTNRNQTTDGQTEDNNELQMKPTQKYTNNQPGVLKGGLLTTDNKLDLLDGIRLDKFFLICVTDARFARDWHWSVRSC